MKNDILVDVLIITYNQENYIEKCVMSAINQKTNFKYRILVGEDCSTDKTKDILKIIENKYPNRLKIIYNKKNIGANDNFNHLLKLSNSKYIAVLDGDDYWIDQNKLQMQYEYMEKNPNCIICHTRTKVVDFQGNDLGYSYPIKRTKSKSDIKDQLKRNLISNLTAFYRNNYVNKIPNYAKKHYATDWIIYILLAQYGTIDFIDYITAAYRINEKGAMKSTNDIDKIKTKIKMYILLKNKLSKKYVKLIDKLINREKSKKYALLSYNYAINNKKNLGLKYLYISLFKYGFNTYCLPLKILVIIRIFLPFLYNIFKLINISKTKSFIKYILDLL